MGAFRTVLYNNMLIFYPLFFACINFYCARENWKVNKKKNGNGWKNNLAAEPFHFYTRDFLGDTFYGAVIVFLWPTGINLTLCFFRVSLYAAWLLFDLCFCQSIYTYVCVERGRNCEMIHHKKIKIMRLGDGTGVESTYWQMAHCGHMSKQRCQRNIDFHFSSFMGLVGWKLR